MSEIEKIQRYIASTKEFPLGTPYQLNMSELFALKNTSAGGVTDAICLAFDYGRAKGYRAAKAEARKAAH